MKRVFEFIHLIVVGPHKLILINEFSSSMKFSLLELLQGSLEFVRSDGYTQK